jgi:hypothetical protein
VTVAPAGETRLRLPAALAVVVALEWTLVAFWVYAGVSFLRARHDFDAEERVLIAAFLGRIRGPFIRHTSLA